MSLLQERNNFIGKQIPTEIKIVSKCLKQFDVDVFSHVVTAASEMLSTSKPDYQTFEKVTSHIDPSALRLLYPGVVTILSRALRLPNSKLKKADFVHDLTELNIPTPCHAPLIKVLFGDARDALDECALANRPRFSNVQDFRWRVDVGISTTSLKRVLEPSVLCNIKTNKNENCTFEITKEKFHELRYAVAEVLNNMQQLEKRSILNIET